jgi:hypothetical protein
MYARPSAPRTIGGVLDDAIRLYRQSFAGIWPISLAAAVIVSLPSLALQVKLERAKAAGGQAVLDMLHSSGYLLTNLVLVVLYVVLYGALIAGLDDFAEHGQASAGNAFGTAFTLLPKLVGATLLLWIALAVGFMLLIIPGIYLSGVFMLNLVALVVERAGVIESFSVSQRLIKGNWWRSVTILTIASIMMLVFVYVGGLIGGLIAGLVGFGTSGAMLGGAIIGVALNVFLLPLVPCCLLSIYFDLKLRHEGGDLSARVDALAAR